MSFHCLSFLQAFALIVFRMLTEPRSLRSRKSPGLGVVPWFCTLATTRAPNLTPLSLCAAATCRGRRRGCHPRRSGPEQRVNCPSAGSRRWTPMASLTSSSKSPCVLSLVRCTDSLARLNRVLSSLTWTHQCVPAIAPRRCCTATSLTRAALRPGQSPAPSSVGYEQVPELRGRVS